LSVPNELARTIELEGSSVSTSEGPVRAGDVVEFTHRGERRTAEAMLVTDDDVVLLDLFDGDRPAWARVSSLERLAVYRPTDALSAA
jgi:hypothetical protein